MVRHFTSRPATAAAAVLLALAAGALPALAEPPSTKDLSIEQRPLADVTAPTSDLKVAVWVDRPDSTYRIGDTVVLSVRTNRDAYVSVINVGSSGRVHVLFPNRHQPNNRVSAHQVLQIPASNAPFSIRVSGPAGHDLIKVIATTRSHQITDPGRLADSGPFRSYDGPAASLAKDLSIELNERHRPGPEDGAAVADKVIRTLAGS